MFEHSMEGNNQSIQKSIDDISWFEADMGGTELYDPLKLLLSQP